MSQTIVRWLLAALVGLLCRWLAVKVGGACPLDEGSFFCSHWETIAGIGAAVLTALGYPVKRPGLAASKAPQKVEPPQPPPEPEPEPEPLGVEVTSANVTTSTPAELERAAAPENQGGG